MKRTPLRLDIKKPRFSPLPFAFLIPFLGMLSVMLINRCEPFGNNYAFLYSDEYHQYYPFYLEFRRSLLKGESLLYNWNIGMGIDYLGLISYYLASPLYLLSVFIPESLVLEYFAMLSPIKLGLAGLFFAIFLRKIFNKNDMSIALFGSFYALCAWAMGYQWNIMWLDTFAMLPLVVLGTVSLLRDKKYILYTITLFLSVFVNYYIGLFTCIFVLLIFICYQICNFTTLKRFAQDFGRIALFTVIAIGMTAILELPALAALGTTYSSNNNFPDHFYLNVVEDESFAAAQQAWYAFDAARDAGAGMGTLMSKGLAAVIKSFPPLLEGMALVAGNMSGELAPTFMEGLPNVACGVGPMLLALLFLTAKEVKLKEKLCCGSLLFLFAISFVIPALDYIWHGFHFTNMIPYRFSFLYSFVVLYMAYRAWILRDTFAPWKLAVAMVLSVVFVFLSEKADDWIFIAYNLAFLLLYLVMFIFSIADKILSRADESEESSNQFAKRQARTRQIKAIVMCCIMFLELVLILVKFGLAFHRTSVSNYPKGTETSASIFSYIKTREARSDFYRVETTYGQTLNDSSLNDYSGISTFTSSANVRVTTFLEAMGLSAFPPYNRYLYEQTSPVANLFLNLKYLVERDNSPIDNPYFDVLYGYDDVYLMENNAYLPLGFLAESTLEEATMKQLLTDENGKEETNEFTKQNTLFSLATGLEEDVWEMVDGNDLNVTGYDIVMQDPIKNHETTYVRYHSTDVDGRMDFSFTVKKAGLLCMEIWLSEENDYTIYINGNEIFTETISVPQVMAISYVEPGDLVEMRVKCIAEVPADDPGIFNIRTALLNDEVFQKGYEILSASTWDIESFSNTLVEGSIDCNRDGVMYTSIPYNGNWVIEVDGKEAEPILVGDAMMAVALTKGHHTVTFRYHNKAFTLGAIISAVCLVSFLCIIFIPPYVKKRKTTPEQ